MTDIDTQAAVTDGLTIRRLGAADQGSLERLAGLDSSSAPTGTVLGAEIEGRLVAAISVEHADSVADPFSRTGELRSLLELRAAQLRRRQTAVRRGKRILFPEPTRAALAGSPPGAGGRLLSLLGNRT